MTRAARNAWMKARGRGAALLSVLVLVALMTVIATLMLDRLNLATRLAANSQSMEQARLYAASAEKLTAMRISELVALDETKTVDRTGILGRETVLPLGRGSVAITIDDGHNCFNLNSLGAGRDGNGGRFNSRARDQFLELMSGLQIPGGDAAVIADSLGDWVDEDQATHPAGAEDDYYLGLPTPYRTPGRAIADVSELRAIRGMTEPIYRRLLPWVCVKPTGERTLVNLNTLRPEQARLLSALTLGQLDINKARGLLASRPPAGWSSVAGAVGMMARGDGAVLGAASLSQMRVDSKLFTARITARVDNAVVQERALIDVSDPPGRVVMRSFGDL